MDIWLRVLSHILQCSPLANSELQEMLLLLIFALINALLLNAKEFQYGRLQTMEVIQGLIMEELL